MRSIFLCLTLISTWPAVALANDGKNRYEGMVPSTLTHLDGPVSKAAGFRVLPGDMEGGADGDPAFRWAARHAIAAVRLAARRTVVELGESAYPLAIFDLAAENGDTPIGWSAEGPRGRHPGGSHDGGMNLDLGYYLTSETGKVESPDPAACTDHYAGEKDGKPVDDNKCNGPADRLDTDRMTLFLVDLVRRHRDDFGGELLENIGIDAVVRREVLARATAWAKKRRFGSSVALVAEMDRLFASSPYEGWQRFHHHHVHVRMAAIDLGGRHARALDALIAEDRRVEAELLAPGGVAFAPELSSTALERELDLRLAGRLTDVRSVRFRKAGGEWEQPEDALEPLHHVMDVERKPGSGMVKVEAEVVMQDGSRRVLERSVALPRQPAFLRVKVDASRIVGRARAEGGDVELSLDMPPVYSTLVTKVELNVRRPGGETEKVALAAPAYSARLKGAVENAEADVTLSGRMHVWVPVVVGRP